MFLGEQIKNIIQLGEGYNAEFKVSVPKKVKELTEEICAFANAAGGILLIGVDDNNQVQGVNINNSKRSSIQNSINEIRPHIQCDIYKVDVDGKEVWAVEVPTGQQKPYTLSGAIYVRQGPNSQKITDVEQMRDFFQQANRIYFDESSCDEFDFENDFDKDFFEEFKETVGLSKEVDSKQIIDNLKITLPNGNFKNGGVLFFGNSPESFFEKAVIRCVAFDGIDKTYIIDDKIYGGPLMHQYTQAIQWLKGKLNVRYEIEGSGPRKELWEIPQTALKEVIINSLSHRDYYDKGGRIMIELFNDRLVISNPGGLVSVIKSHDFGKISHSRNPLIFGLFERMDMVEQVGSGISRIRTALKVSGLPMAEFNTEGLFSVVLKRATKVDNNTVKTREKTRDKIISLIRTNNSITTAEIANAIGITDKGVEYHLYKLTTQGVLKHKGAKKTGKWVILQQDKN